MLDNTRDLKLRGVDPVQGRITASRYPDAAGMQAARKSAMEQFGHDLDDLPTRELRDLVKSDRFHDGLMDRDGYHIQPLNYVVGLAAEVQSRDGMIFERSTMTSMDLSGRKDRAHGVGMVKSRYVVLCGSGYSGRNGRLRKSCCRSRPMLSHQRPGRACRRHHGDARSGSGDANVVRLLPGDRGGELRWARTPRCRGPATSRR